MAVFLAWVAIWSGFSHGPDFASAAPDIAPEQFRISHMGPDGDPDYDALNPAVAYNATNKEYLTVWAATDEAEGLHKTKFEIYGQGLDGATGERIGERFRISHTGSNDEPAAWAQDPTVAWNAIDNEYLVVWEVFSNVPETAGVIRGQRIDGAAGGLIGENEFLISGGSSTIQPALAWNSLPLPKSRGDLEPR